MHNYVIFSGTPSRSSICHFGDVDSTKADIADYIAYIHNDMYLCIYDLECIQTNITYLFIHYDVETSIDTPWMCYLGDHIHITSRYVTPTGKVIYKYH